MNSIVTSDTSVTLEYSYYLSGSGSSGTMTVVLTCNADGSALQVGPGAAAQPPTNDPKTKTYFLYLQSNLVCPSGISGGGVFLILIFVCPLIYVLVFGVINFVQGKRGVDLAPHPEFWKEVWSLAKEGVQFTKSKMPCLGGSSAGGAASAGYQAVAY